MSGTQVEAAMRAVPRVDFLPRRHRRRAEHDGPLPIGHGQTNSQPRTVVDMLELLQVHPGDRVLDVGSGSGWTTALLAHLTGPSGVVRGVEIVTDLVVTGRANVAAAQLPWASIVAATPGVLGLPEGAPYDRILVSADAPEVPEPLVDQLAPGGRMVVPVRGRMLALERTEDGVRLSEHGRYRFVPLITR